jgi:adenosine deaminase
VTERVPLTVCPLSNVRLRVFPSMERHNLGEMLERGLRVTINSDDPAYFGGYLVDNYLAAQRALGLTREQIVRLADSGLRSTFLGEDEVAPLLAELADYVARS